MARFDLPTGENHEPIPIRHPRSGSAGFGHGIRAGQEDAAQPATTGSARPVDRETKGATVKGFATEMEHGKRVYEAETVVSGHTRDLQITEDGTLSEVEEEVALDTLPTGVRDALVLRTGKGKIQKVESLTKSGKLVAYEALIVTRGKKGEVQVGPSGESLSHAE